MPRMGIPASNSSFGIFGLPLSLTNAGPPERMIPFGACASIFFRGVQYGITSANTPVSRTRRAMTLVYCDPKSTTTMPPCEGLTPFELADECRMERIFSEECELPPRKDFVFLKKCEFAPEICVVHFRPSAVDCELDTRGKEFSIYSFHLGDIFNNANIEIGSGT